MIKNYKFRLYPNKTQQIQLNQCMGCVRFIYNWALDIKIKNYEEQKEIEVKEDRSYISMGEISKRIPDLKKEYPFLKEAVSTSLIHSLKNLDLAFKNFFNGIKKGANVGYPKFKSKYKNRDSMAFHQHYVISENKIKVPKYGWIKYVRHRDFEGETKTVTITRTPTNKYYLTITVNDGIENTGLKTTKAERTVGLDIGAINSITLSDGFQIENTLNARILKYEKILRRRQRNLSRKTNGSNNKNKARLRVARVHEKISNMRENYIKKIAFDLNDYLVLNNYDTVYTQKYEMLNILKKKKASENREAYESFVHKIKKEPILKASLGMMQDLIFTKIAENVNLVVVSGKNSNKFCSSCNYYYEDFEYQSNRIFTCPKCNAKIDIDLNRSRNLNLGNYED